MSRSGFQDWVGTTLTGGRYTVQSLLGAGGMGYVYRATDQNLSQDVVIKVPRPEMLVDPSFAARFASEIRSLVRLSHPHVVKVVDAGQHAGLPYAVLQYLSGGSLESRRNRNAQGMFYPMPVGSVHSWLIAIGQALDFVHSQGYVHRDVKPANILFDQHGNAYLGDFGVAKVLNAAQDARASNMTGTGLVMGTPDFLAPELVMGESFDGRVDQYALAATLFDLLTGRPPFVASTVTAVLVAHSTATPPLAHQLQSSIPEQLSACIHRALSKAQQDRFASCSEFAQAVCAFAGGQVEVPVVAAAKHRFGRVSRVKNQRGACPVCQQTIVVSDRSRGILAACPGCQSSLSISVDLKSIAEVLATPSRGTTTVSQSLRETPGLTPPVAPPPIVSSSLPAAASHTVSSAVPPTPLRRKHLLSAVVGAVIVLLAAMLMVGPFRLMTPEIALKLQPIEPRQLAADEPLTILLQVASRPEDSAPPRFALLGEVPPGMVIDEQAGRITWPAEDRPTGEYSIRVQATIDTPAVVHDEIAIAIRVNPPLPEPTPGKQTEPMKTDPQPSAVAKDQSREPVPAPGGSMPSPPPQPGNSNPSSKLLSVSLKSLATAPVVAMPWTILVVVQGAEPKELQYQYALQDSAGTSEWTTFDNPLLTLQIAEPGPITVHVRATAGSRQATSTLEAVVLTAPLPAMNTEPIEDLILRFESNARAYYRQNLDKVSYQSECDAVRALVDRGRKEPAVIRALLNRFALHYRHQVPTPIDPGKPIAKNNLKMVDNRYLRPEVAEAFGARYKPFMHDLAMRDQPDLGNDAIAHLYNMTLPEAPDKAAPPSTFDEIARKELPYLRLLLYIGSPAIPTLRLEVANGQKQACIFTLLAKSNSEAIPVLLEILAQEDSMLKRAALWALAHQLHNPAHTALAQTQPALYQQVFAELFKTLDNPEEPVRLFVLHLLAGQFPETGRSKLQLSQPELYRQTIDRLFETLNDSQESVQYLTLQLLSEQSAQHPELVGKIVSRLEKLLAQASPTHFKRIVALAFRFQELANVIIPQVVTVVRQERLVYANGLDFLVNCGPDGEQELVKLAIDASLAHELREQAILKIGLFKARAAPASVTALAGLLQAGQSSLRKSILQTFRDLGPAAKPAETLLKQLQKLHEEKKILTEVELLYVGQSLKNIGVTPAN